MLGLLGWGGNFFFSFLKSVSPLTFCSKHELYLKSEQNEWHDKNDFFLFIHIPTIVVFPFCWLKESTSTSRKDRSSLYIPLGFLEDDILFCIHSTTIKIRKFNTEQCFCQIHRPHLPVDTCPRDAPDVPPLPIQGSEDFQFSALLSLLDVERRVLDLDVLESVGQCRTSSSGFAQCFPLNWLRLCVPGSDGVDVPGAPVRTPDRS